MIRRRSSAANQFQSPTPKLKKELRARTASTKVTDSEFAELESYAYQHGQSVSEWIRQTLLNEVREPHNGSMNHYIFTELVGVQLLLINSWAPDSRRNDECRTPGCHS